MTVVVVTPEVVEISSEFPALPLPRLANFKIGSQKKGRITIRPYGLFQLTM